MKWFCLLSVEHEGLTLPLCRKDQCQVCIDYQAGITKPAYPMPAIIYEAVEHEEAIYLWQKTLNGYVYVTTWYRD